MGALTPLVQGTRSRSTYASTLVVHTVASVWSGALVGSILGWLGSRVVSHQVSWQFWLGLGLVSLLLVAREFGALRVPIPQVRRQTGKTWYFRFGPIGAAWWWGIDLGSGLTSLITFSAYWLLLLVVFFSRSPQYGGIVLGMFGIGRAATTWITPYLFGAESDLRLALADLLQQRHRIHVWHRYGLLAVTIAVLVRGLLLSLAA